ncbi:MAG: GNAT family protein [Anaerolineaceae bacterium]|nr:GNAT family protein [Anaerolineaceae bacterium]
MIIGKRIRLRGAEREDIPRFVTWLNDPEVYVHLTPRETLSRAEEEQWFEKMLELPMEEHIRVIEVDTAEGWQAIGNISLMKIDWRERSAEIGIFIGEKHYWSQGYGREAMQLMVKHGFSNLNLNRLYLRVDENNPRAIRSYEHAGFIQEGRLRQARFVDNMYIDTILMSVLHSEWQEKTR